MTLKSGNMLDPYSVYILSFLVVILVYQLNWSSLYPILDSNLLLFLLATFAVAIIVANIFRKTLVLPRKKISFSTKSNKIVLLLYLSWAMDFAYGRGIPLLLALRGIEYELTDFAIPFFHVLLVTFNSFFCTYLFHNYLSNRTWKSLQHYIVSFVPFIFLFARGAILMNIISSLFVYLNFKSSLNKNFLNAKVFIITFVCFIPLLYIFGVSGNIRTAAVYGRDDHEIILDIGHAVPEYRDSIIPKEFFWSYLYISSPLANLQEAINKSKISNISSDNILQFVSNEVLPDFISKRLNEAFSIKRATTILITEDLTVATVYANSFLYLSWFGLIMMALLIISFPLIYSKRLMNDNPFYLTGISTMNTLYLFLIFDNMFVFSGLSFQLVYPLFMAKFIEVKFLREEHISAMD
jgi:hypothetical protein